MTTATASTTLAQQLAGWVIGLRPEELPEPVRDAAKLHALDAVGIAIASTGMDYGRAMHSAGEQLGRGEESRVLGLGPGCPRARQRSSTAR